MPGFGEGGFSMCFLTGSGKTIKVAESHISGFSWCFVSDFASQATKRPQDDLMGTYQVKRLED